MFELDPPFRVALPKDAQAIAAVVNEAHAGDADSWTHEGGLFEGLRTDASEIRGLIATPSIVFLLLSGWDELAGCLFIRLLGSSAYIGLLAVRPSLQGSGVGRSLLDEAERIASEHWHCAIATMTVITRERPELASFYQRRGYVRTGRFKALERKGARERAKVPGLLLEWLEKDISQLGNKRNSHA